MVIINFCYLLPSFSYFYIYSLISWGWCSCGSREAQSSEHGIRTSCQWSQIGILFPYRTAPLYMKIQRLQKRHQLDPHQRNGSDRAPQFGYEFHHKESHHQEAMYFHRNECWGPTSLVSSRLVNFLFFCFYSGYLLFCSLNWHINSRFI